MINKPEFMGIATTQPVNMWGNPGFMCVVMKKPTIVAPKEDAVASDNGNSL